MCTAALCLALVLSSVAAFASDGDSDKVEDDQDNCQGSANPLQFDADGDGIGDLCELESAYSDEFVGTPGSDLVFGTFRDSILSGLGGPDSLYGEGGNDLLDGGAGVDALVGGPGDDTLIGGPNCDTFAIQTRIEHRDVIVDFNPTVDRVRFPPLFREATLDRFPDVERVAGTDDLEVRFLVGDEPFVTVVFAGLNPNVPVVLSTRPCGQAPPPAAICPKPAAYRTMVFVGFEDRFCPGRGELRLNTGILATDRYNVASGKRFGEPLASKSESG